MFVSAGAGTGKTAVLVERFVRAVCDRGLDVDSILVITYTRRAAGELRTRIRAALGERGRQDLARELDGAWISTIHGFCLRLLKAYPFAAGLDPRFRELDDAQGASCAARRSARARRRSTATATRTACGCSRRTGPTACAACSPASTRRCARLGASCRSTSASAATSRSRVAELREAARCLAERGGVDGQPADGGDAAARAARRDTRADRLMDLSGFRAAGERAASYEEARQRAEHAALDEAAVARPRAPPGAARRFRRRVRRGEGARVGARLRGPPAARAQPPPRQRRRFASARAALPLDHGRRVPGHEPAPVRSGRSACEGPGTRGLLRRRRVPVDLRVPACGRASLPRAPRSCGAAAAADAQLPLAPGGARGGQRALRLALRRRVPAARGARRVSRPGVRPPGRAARHRQGELRRHRRALAARRGAARRAARARARRRRRRGGRRDRAPLRRRHRRRVVRGGAAQAGPADVPRDRARLLRPAAGRRPALVPAPAAQPLRRRRAPAVLASPFVGISNDGLALVRRAAPSGRSSPRIERSLPPALDERDARLLRAFRQRFDRLGARWRALSLERLCERIVGDHDYDLAVLAQLGRPPPLREHAKLARLARSYEELRGPDVEGFVRFVGEQEAVGARELEAVAEEEGADAVRLLTIHAAKGLEFKVVIVADAGRDKAPPSADEILALSDGRFGFRVADPATTKRRGAFDYDDVREARRAEDEAEQLRLYYVAMTRAIDRLIVSGALDRERKADATTPIGWVLGRLDADEELDAAGAAPVELERDGARLVVRVDRFAEAAGPTPRARSRDAEAGQLELFAALEDAAPRPRAPAAGARAAARSRRSTGSAGSRSRRSRRSSTARTSTTPRASPGMRGAPGARGAGGGACARPRSATPSTGCSSWSTSPRRRCPSLEQVRPGTRPCGRGARARSRRSSTSYCESELARRVAALRARTRSGPSRSSTTASSCTASRRPPPRRARGARRRLQDEPDRRVDAGGDRRGRLPVAAARLRARLLPRRGGGGRGRLPVPRAARRASSRRRSRATDLAALEAELSAAIARIQRASSGRRRASSPARAARRSTRVRRAAAAEPAVGARA